MQSICKKTYKGLRIAGRQENYTYRVRQ